MDAGFQNVQGKADEGNVPFPQSFVFLGEDPGFVVDVDGIMSGRVADIPICNEDVLYIPSKRELQEDMTLTIHGEVMYPGIYKYAANSPP